MKIPRCFTEFLWIVFLGSVLLNAGLLWRLNNSQVAQIDLRRFTVKVGSAPPSLPDVKFLFDKGDHVISITDPSNSKNLIVMFYSKEDASDLVWYSIIGKSFFRGGSATLSQQGRY